MSKWILTFLCMGTCGLFANEEAKPAEKKVVILSEEAQEAPVMEEELTAEAEELLLKKKKAKEAKLLEEEAPAEAE